MNKNMFKLKNWGKKLVIPFLGLCLSFFVITSVQAAPNNWENVNPPGLGGGTISAIGAAGEYLYLGTSQGVYKSNDYGINWDLIPGSPIDATSIAIGWTYSGVFLVDETSHVYVGTLDGVFKSTLGGVGSTTLTKIISTNGFVVNDIKIDQFKDGGATSSTLYLSTTASGGLYRSDDEGETWSQQNGSMNGEVVKKIITEWDSAGTGGIYAITNSNSVASTTMNSKGGAEDWSIGFSTTTTLNNIVLNNSISNIIYLATDNGILRSTDGGANWLDKNGGIATSSLIINAVASDYNLNNVLFSAGLTGAYVSVGDGPQGPDSVYLGDYWVKADAGMMGQVVLNNIITNPVNSDYVYAHSTSTVYKMVLANVAGIMAGDLASSDTVAPAQMFISVSNAGTSTMDLTWLNVGDDMYSGTAALYEIRYATTSINNANWATATPVTDAIPAPVAPNSSTVTITVTGLLPETGYYFAMVAVDETGNQSIISNPVYAATDKTAPTVPVGLTIGSTSASVINLSWTASTDPFGVGGYEIYRATTTGSLVLLATTSDIYFSDNSGKSFTSYTYALKSYDVTGNISATSTTASTYTLPTAPLNFSAVPASDTVVNLSWSTTSEAISYYIIYNGATQIATTSSSVGAYSHTGLIAGTLYNYTVRSFGTPGYYSVSSTASTSTTPDVIAPTTPANLVVGTTSASTINISWTASTDNVGVVGYRVYRATSTGLLSPTPLATTTNIFYSDTSARSLTAYSYRVDAYDLAGYQSGMSATTSTTTVPLTPVNFAATPVSTSGISLSWSTTTEAISYYIIYNGVGAQIATTSPASSSYSITGLSAGTAYSYSIRAYVNSGLLSAPDIKSATTQSNPVVAPSGGGGGVTTPTCSAWSYSVWSVCAGGRQYRIVSSSSPLGCSGGTPLLSQVCTVSTSTPVTGTGTTTPPVISNPTTTTSATTPAMLIDSDKDGLMDDFEVALGTNPLKADTDGDGFSDKDELLKDYNPVVTTKKLAIDWVFAKKNQGKVFLQVENKGQAWYVNPKDLKRYYLGRPANAFEVMRKQGLGVLHKVITDTTIYPTRLVGKILIDVEDKGKAYYINPKDKKAYYMGRPSDAFELMRRLGVGITNAGLEKISIGF